MFSGGEMDPVQQTNTDATICKRSAVKLNYWSDPFLSHFCPDSGPHALPRGDRKAPEIHLGYFTRVRGLRRLLDRVMNISSTTSIGVPSPGASTSANGASAPAPTSFDQVISFGAGFDTLYWRLKSDGVRLHKFVEVDFAGVTARKCALIRKSKVLLEALAKDAAGAADADDGDEVRVGGGGTDLHGRDYHLVAGDLAGLSALEQKLTECGVDFSRPTVFLAECVLVYMAEQASSDLLKWCTTRFGRAPLVFLNHEQLHMRDRFGQVMLENLAARGCGLPGAGACLSRDTQMGRFVRQGWHGAHCWTMNEVYSLLPAHEVQAVERLEMFDERELMRQLFEHYCIAVAWRNSEQVNLDDLDFWE